MTQELDSLTGIMESQRLGSDAEIGECQGLKSATGIRE